MTPLFTAPAEVRSTTSWMPERARGESVTPGDHFKSAMAAAAKASQTNSAFGWNRSGGRFFNVRRGLLLSGSGISI